MKRPILILLNTRARNGGARRLQAEIQTAFDRLSIIVEIRRVRRNLAGTTQDALQDGYTVIVAAGGDGTIRTVAEALADSQAVLGVIPAGTFNHFAKDLDIPLDINGAVGVIVRGHHRSVDYATVNGRFFLSSASMGLHPLFVRRRQAYEPRLGKWLAIPVATAQAWWRFSAWRLTLEVAGRRHELTSPFVFIGNNDYQRDRLGLPKRTQSGGGMLYIYALECRSRRQLLWLMLRGLLGRLDVEASLRSFVAPTCQIEANGRISLTVDGELTQQAPPLEFHSRSSGLNVLTP